MSKEHKYKIPHDGRWRLTKAKLMLDTALDPRSSDTVREEMLGMAIATSLVAIAERLYDTEDGCACMVAPHKGECAT